MLKVAVIADDLTGAADTGVLFLPVAGEVRLLSLNAFVERVQSGFFGGLAVNTDTRQMSLQDALERVERAALALKTAGADLVYKKIDSCLRGHVGGELARLAQACGRAGVLAAPAYPTLGRTTRNDIHYVRNMPVAESEAGRDPVRPVLNSSLTGNLSAGHDAPVGHIPASVLEAGPRAVEERIARLLAGGCLLLGADAECDDHLDLLARVALQSFPDLILAGSAGLAGAVARRLAPAAVPPLPDFTLPGPALFVGGSASRVLRSQLEHLAAHQGLPLRVLNAGDVLAGLPEPEQAALCAAVAGRDSILCLSPPEPGNPLPSRDLALALGKLAARLLACARPGTVFASGGDTAQAILDTLGNPELLIRCEPAPGLIVSSLDRGPHAALYFLTKSGGFGAPELLTGIHARLFAGSATFTT